MATNKKDGTTKNTSSKPKMVVRKFIDPTVNNDNNVTNTETTNKVEENVINNTPNTSIPSQEKQEQIKDNNTQNSNIEVNKTQNTNINPDNKNPIKKPKKKGFWRHLGFSERLLLIIFSVFTVGAIAAIPIYTNVINKTFIVTFNPNYEGSSTTTVQVKKDETVAKPTNPTRKDYAFLGWKKENESEYYNFSDKVTSNITLLGTWTDEYTITFDLNYEGSKTTESKVIKGAKVVKPEEPLRENDIFEGWYIDKECVNPYNFENTVDKSFTLYAKWRAKNSYVFTFDLNYDDAPKLPTSNIKERDLLKKPDDPNRQYYNFVNWYTDKGCSEGNIFDFTKPVTGESRDITLYAKWEEIKYTVTFYSNANGKEYEKHSSETITIKDNKKFTEIDPPEYEHFTFLGWYKADGVKYDFNQDATGDLDLFSKYSQTVCKVTLDLNYDGKPEPVVNNINHGEILSTPADPIRGGYSFLGWFTKSSGGEKFDFSKPIVDTELTIYAQWQILDLTSISVGNIKSKEFCIDDTVDTDNFVVKAIFNDDSETVLQYDNTGASGYKVSSTKISNFELPHTFVNGDLGSDTPIKFEYTFNNDTKDCTVNIDILAGKIEIKPAEGTYKYCNIGRRLKDIDQWHRSSFKVTDFITKEALESLEVSLTLDEDGTDIDFGYDISYLTTYEYYALVVYGKDTNNKTGPATLTVKLKEAEQIVKAGSVKVEVGCYSGFKFEEIDKDNYSMTIDPSPGEWSTKLVDYDLVTPLNYYYTGENGEACKAKVSKYVKPATVTDYSKTAISSVIFSENITSLSDECFLQNTNLKSVVFDKNLTAISDRAFRLCSSLEEIAIPEGVKTIGHHSFYQTTLTSIKLPDSIIELGNRCFANANKEKVYIDFVMPKNVESIGAYVLDFTDLNNVTIELPATLKHLQAYAFSNTGPVGDRTIIFNSNVKTNWKIYTKELYEEVFKRDILENELADENTTKLLMIDEYINPDTGENDGGYANYIWRRVVS